MPKDIVKSSEHLGGEQLRGHSRLLDVSNRKGNSRSSRERAMERKNKSAPRTTMALVV